MENRLLLTIILEKKSKIKNSILTIFLTLILLCFFGNENSFAQLAINKNKFVGNIVGNAGLRTDFTKYWNQVTAENAGKWGSVEAVQGSYSWTSLDNIYNFAVSNNLLYKHHTLVWGQQYPAFVASIDSASLYAEIENWIKLAGQKYPKANMVDVVNEPLHSFTGTATNLVKALGGNGTTGWDWVIKAFELARKYWSPTTKLLINDYNIINDASATNNYLKLINILKSKNLVDGIGIQAHSFEVVGPSIATLKSNLSKLTATGLPIYISEFDINLADDAQQLQYYKSVFPTLYEDPGVAGITLWGYVIGYMWQTNAYLINDRKAERPALQWLRTYLLAPFRPAVISPAGTYDESLTPKLTWHRSASATSYHVQVSNSRSFTPIIIDSTITDTTFQTKKLDPNSVYYWRVSAKNNDAEGEFTDIVSFVTLNVVDVKESGTLPNSVQLCQNYPNPFNPTTTITFYLPQRSNINLVLMDILGREIAKLAYGNYEAGTHSVQLDATGFPSGMYIYRLQTGNYQSTKKMLLLK